MTLSKKVEIIQDIYGLTKQELAAKLGLNYQVMARNIAANKLTIDFVAALKVEYPDIDLNWIFTEDPAIPMVMEPREEYVNPKAAIEKIRDLLGVIEKGLQQ